MDGSWRTDCDGKYTYRLQVNGKRYSVRGESKAECRKKMAEKIRKGAEDKEYKAGRGMLQDMMGDWLTRYKRGTIKSTSYDRLERTYLHQIRGHPIGRIQVRDLTTGDVQQYLNDLDRQGLSGSTVKKVKDIICAFLDYWQSDGNRCQVNRRLLKLPHQEAERIRVLDDREIEALCRELDKPPSPGKVGYRYGLCLQLLIWDFLRIGEALTLTWGDYDRATGMITINKQLIRTQKRGKSGSLTGGTTISISPPKYGSSRAFRQHKRAVEVLERYRELYALDVRPQSLIFCTRSGKYLMERHLLDMLRNALRRAGIDKQLTLHDLRHTGISYYLRHRLVDVKAISAAAGHKDVSVTMRVYYNLLPEQLEELFTEETTEG